MVKKLVHHKPARRYFQQHQSVRGIDLAQSDWTSRMQPTASEAAAEVEIAALV